MRILALDSSAVSASCCLTDDGKLVSEFFINTSLTHSQTLLPMVESMLKNSGMPLSSVDLYAVSNGPGSFTGIRIGVATIKGLAYANDKPCIGVSTLEALAFGSLLPVGDPVICAVMDARCSQVYNALFGIKGGKPERLTADRAIPLADLCDEIKNVKKPIIMVGDGADLCYNYCLETGAEIYLPSPDKIYQRASGVALAAQAVRPDAGTVSARELGINYLRLPQATRELLKNKKG